MQEVVLYLSYFKNSIAFGTLSRTPLGELTKLSQTPHRVKRETLPTPLTRCIFFLSLSVLIRTLGLYYLTKNSKLSFIPTLL